MIRSKIILLSTSCILSLSACESFKEFNIPEAPQGFEDTDISADGNERFSAAAPVNAWWKTLQDTQLTMIIEQSLDNNKDVQIALANLFEARGISSETEFDQFPTVTSSSSATRTRQNDSTSNLVDAGFDASWELDLFGRVSSAVDAAEAREAAANASLRDVYVSIAAETAKTYIDLRGAQYRLDIAKRNVANQEETFGLTKRLTDAGRGTALDTVQASTQLQLTKASIPSLEAEVTAAINRLSVLTGQVPNSLRAELKRAKALPSIPAAVNVGNSTDLLRRRPDIVRAERELEAAIADYNISVADQFPTVNILGTLGFSATNFASFGASTLLASGGATINWPAFDMGRVRARIRQNDARSLAALAAYEKAVLEALEDVQTSISDFSQEEQRRRQLQQAAISAKEAANIARLRYKSGLDTFIDVLNTEATLLTTEDSLAISEISAAQDLISVYKGLGGGWQVKEEPTPSP